MCQCWWGSGAVVDEASCRREETVFAAGGFGLDRPQPLTGGECFNEYKSGVGGVQHDLPCMPQCPGGMQVLEGRQVAADHLFSISDDTLQSAPVFDGSSSVPDGD